MGSSQSLCACLSLCLSVSMSSRPHRFLAIIKLRPIIARSACNRRPMLTQYNFYRIALSPKLVSGVSQCGTVELICDLVQPKMSPALSFAGMYRRSFIYCRNRTSYFSIKSSNLFFGLISLISLIVCMFIVRHQ